MDFNSKDSHLRITVYDGNGNWDIWLDEAPHGSYRHLRDPETRLDTLRENYPDIVVKALEYTKGLLVEEGEILP